MTNQSPIGILDSGVGGLSVWSEIRKLLPYESTIYIADSAKAPYGALSTQEIFLLSKRLIEFLISKDVKMVVVACNTITVTCIEELRKTFPSLEIVGVVPAIKTATTLSKTKRIGVLTTKRTAKSTYQQTLLTNLASDFTVVTVGTNSLVPLIERGDRAELKSILGSILKPFTTNNIDTLVLGCTHFPLIKDLIQKEVGERVTIIDSGQAIARRVETLLKKNGLQTNSKRAENIFFTTGSSDNGNKILQIVS